jgi:hypothetical protein
MAEKSRNTNEDKPFWVGSSGFYKAVARKLFRAGIHFLNSRIEKPGTNLFKTFSRIFGFKISGPHLMADLFDPIAIANNRHKTFLFTLKLLVLMFNGKRWLRSGTRIISGNYLYSKF